MPDSRPDITRLAFSVDTHLFRELGKLLVGRDSTALIELVKNAYDADATKVVLHADRLDGPEGMIRIVDDGVGMSFDDFETRFLRIAGRSKEGTERRSGVYGRRFTGAKGIGRLSAYKLAEVLEVESVPAREGADGVEAVVDWTALENAEGDVQETDLVRARHLPSAASNITGTSLSLTRLRLAPGRARQRFLREVRGTRPDRTLYQPLPDRVLKVPLLMPSIKLADAKSDAPFDIELSGELDPGDQPWPSLLAAMQWVIEIDAREPTVVYRVSPTPLQRAQQPASEAREFKHERPPDEAALRFAARILARASQQTATGARLPDLLERFSQEVSGIRLYMEGFQVLPYGTAGNDWLQIDSDRARRSPLRFEDAQLPEASETDQRTYQLSNRNYIGAVFLHEETSGGLEMVVNREGFLPGPAMENLVDLVRRGVDLSVRVRAALSVANREQAEELKRQQRRKLLEEHERRQAAEQTAEEPEDEAPRPASREDQLEALVGAARAAVRGLRRSGAAARPEDVTLVRAALDETQASLEAVRNEQSQLRVLASVGTQFGAFIHEVNGLLGQARIVLQMLDAMLDEESVGRTEKTRLRPIRRATLELVASLERQAIYLTDTIGAEARRRRSRQPIAERFQTAMRLLSLAAERLGVAVDSDIPPSLKTPPMFPAEMNVILTNIISNGIKAAGRGGRVVLSAKRGEGEVLLRADNTGAAVDLENAERWFRPFETTTSGIDDALGQGMGLGLPLTRRIVEEYGGDIRFVPPLDGFATGVQVTFPQGLR